MYRPLFQFNTVSQGCRFASVDCCVIRQELRKSTSQEGLMDGSRPSMHACSECGAMTTADLWFGVSASLPSQVKSKTSKEGCYLPPQVLRFPKTLERVKDHLRLSPPSPHSLHHNNRENRAAQTINPPYVENSLNE